MEEKDFETEFMSDEEVDEFFDSVITSLRNAKDVDNDSVSLVNPHKIQQVSYTYKVLKYLTKGSKVKVEYRLYEPYPSMGYVCVTGKNIQLNNTDWFLKAVDLSDNFEVFPKTDGTVEMNFTFHGLTRTID